jgi:hypothetical protein
MAETRVLSASRATKAAKKRAIPLASAGGIRSCMRLLEPKRRLKAESCRAPLFVHIGF